MSKLIPPKRKEVKIWFQGVSGSGKSLLQELTGGGPKTPVSFGGSPPSRNFCEILNPREIFTGLALL